MLRVRLLRDGLRRARDFVRQRRYGEAQYASKRDNPGFHDGEPRLPAMNTS